MVLRPNDLHRARHDAMSISAPLLGSTLASRATVDILRSRPTRLVDHPKLANGERRMVGLSRFELLTPRLSSVCSNQLSYRPRSCLDILVPGLPGFFKEPLPVLSKLDSARSHTTLSTRSILITAELSSGHSLERR